MARSEALLVRLWIALRPVERLALGLAILLILATTGLLLWQRWIASTVAVPIAGGSYTEGIVAATLADVQPTIDRLTKVGLVRIENQRDFLPAAAERWEVSEDGKQYTFYLHPAVDMTMVQNAIEARRDLFPETEIQVDTEQHQILFRLKQPFTPFLATTATPIFELGPFSVAQELHGHVELTARATPILPAPYLEQITLNIYPDSFNLTQALSAGDIDGVANVETVENARLLEKLSTYTIELPRRIYLFFNTEREPIAKSEIRRRLKNGESLDEPISLNLVTLANPKNEALSADLALQWKELGVTVSVTTRTASELAKDVVPQRDYDLLIYGLDFGADPDPYPFWHSSQITESGLNLSKFANIDADRILEKARQTTDLAQRDTLYQEFQAIFDREVPAIELERIVASYGVDPRIHGVSSHAGQSVADRYQNVSQWYKKTKRQPTQNELVIQ